MDDLQLMRRCFALAQQARGRVAPNPMVGAVLVRDGSIIGEGWHHYYGSDHAEVNCLRNVAAEDKHLIPGSTMYVSLEPCAHYGITPPCADRLVKEQLGRVVISNIDHNDKVAGRGIAVLRNAGIEVLTGIGEQEGLWLNRRFFCLHVQRRPYIILKWAQSADGFIAPKDRSRLQLTGPESQQLVHRWRTEEAAIMVGTTTALVDDPQLTARLWEGAHPLRIIPDRNLQLPRTHNIFDDSAATWILNERHEALEGNIHSIKLSFGDGFLDALMRRLLDQKISSLIVEGGAALLGSFIARGLWDEARIFTAPLSLNDGIAAPFLKDEVSAFTTTSGQDRLDVYVNRHSRYPWIPGMEL